MEFEYQRQQEKERTAAAAEEKARQLEQVKIQNEAIQEKKKQEFLHLQQVADERLRLLEIEK
jgi:hypothetical protein